MSAKRTIAVAAVGLVMAFASYAAAQEKAKRCYAKPKGETAVLKDKPDGGAADKGKVLYGQRLLYTKTEKDKAGKPWLYVKEPGGGNEGWLPRAMASGRRPPAMKLGSIRGRTSKTGAGGTEGISTAAVRSLDKRAKEYAATKGGDDKDRMDATVNMVSWLEARVDGSAEDEVTGLFPNRKAREKKAKEFQGGSS